MEIHGYKTALKKIHEHNIKMIEQLYNSDKYSTLFDNQGRLLEWVYEFSCPYHQYEEHGDNLFEVIRIAGVHNQMLKEML